MKVLLDSCVWGGVRADLATAGSDVVWAGEWSEDPGDGEILARAHVEGRVLVTLDKDFGELAIVRGRLHVGIVRVVRFAAREQARACLSVFARCADAGREARRLTCPDVGTKLCDVGTPDRWP